MAGRRATRGPQSAEIDTGPVPAVRTSTQAPGRAAQAGRDSRPAFGHTVGPMPQPNPAPPVTVSASLGQLLVLLLRRLARRLSRPSFVAYVSLGLFALGMLLGYRWSERTGMAQLAAVASERLELYAATLEAEMARHAYLPSLIAIDADVLAMLQAPEDPRLRLQAGLRLARINARAGAIMSYITDAQGQVLATSQARPQADDSTLRQAMSFGDNPGHFFAANAFNGSLDFFLVQPLHRGGRRAGLIVVKLNLGPLEATWVDLGLRSQAEKLMVVDDNDVVIMSSVPGWKYHLLGAADSARRAELRATGRYASGTLQPLGADTEPIPQLDASLVRLPITEPGQPRPGSWLLAQERAVVPLGLRLVTLSDPAEVWKQARYAAWGGGAFGAFVGMLALYLVSRQRALRQLFRAQNELQRAHGQLERLVDERTGELRNTNEELKRQIAQRLQAEDELMQAGKLAALGQLSAGISHEINQPLTALRALSRNSLQLLEHGRHASVAENLRAIDDMVERMGRITRQLKNFARKADPTHAPVSLAAAVQAAQQLLEHRLHAEQVQFSAEIDPQLRVRCESYRLEQVLVNLAANAMDAMRDSALKRLGISAAVEGERVCVRVTDSGCGLDDAQLARLFEPFFTTKPAGEGLGLGLVISSKIVHEFGGTLRGRRADQGTGMVFEFDLALAQEDDPHV